MSLSQHVNKGAMSSEFYDQLAPYYHLLYGDWEAAIAMQSAELSQLLQDAGVSAGAKILDAACGIGTQALGLASRGFLVEASDISAGAVARLRTEAARRGIKVTAFVDDLRTLAQTANESVAAILSCDNSIPHLPSDAEIFQAFQSFYRCLQPGGIVLLSVRDYATIERKSPDVRPYGLRYEGTSRFPAVQVWEWDQEHYDLRIYLTSESGDGECKTHVLHSRYYAITIDRLLRLLVAAGFIEVQRKDEVFFQPVLLGRKPSAV
jgi:SAM-dependent methyltransferase